MPVQRIATSEAIFRMDALCQEALLDNDGIRIWFGTKNEAIKLRQKIYSARMALFKRQSETTAALMQVEMALEEHESRWCLHILPQNATVKDLLITRGSEEVKLSLQKADEFEDKNKIYFEIKKRFDLSTPKGLDTITAEVDRLYYSGYRAGPVSATAAALGLKLGTNK